MDLNSSKPYRKQINLKNKHITHTVHTRKTNYIHHNLAKIKHQNNRSVTSSMNYTFVGPGATSQPNLCRFLGLRSNWLIGNSVTRSVSITGIDFKKRIELLIDWEVIWCFQMRILKVLCRNDVDLWMET